MDRPNHLGQPVGIICHLSIFCRGLLRQNASLLKRQMAIAILQDEPVFGHIQMAYKISPIR